MSIVITTAVATALDVAATSAVDNALATSLGAASVLQIRTGAAPGPENAATGTLLASATFATWTAGMPGDGQLAGSDADPVAASGTGQAQHFRLQTSGGTAIMEGSVGLAAADLILDNVDIVAGGTVDLGSAVITIPVTAPTS